MNGLSAYKAALETVAGTYPNTEEGKNAHEIVEKQIPMLENKNFDSKDSKHWKILYPLALNNVNDKKILRIKLQNSSNQKMHKN